jgi:hypothetical protein
MSDLPPQLLRTLADLKDATKAHTAATLAAAIISASGKPYSIEQALEIVNDIQFAMHPRPGHGAYIEWEKTKAQRLSKVHGG